MSSPETIFVKVYLNNTLTLDRQYPSSTKDHAGKQIELYIKNEGLDRLGIIDAQVFSKSELDAARSRAKKRKSDDPGDDPGSV